LLTLVCCLLGMVLVSSSFTVPAMGTDWIGNDNGEFDTNTSGITYAFVQASFNTSLSWSNSPPFNVVSLQYNPDYDTSWYNQVNRYWFQSIIYGASNASVLFSVEIYNMTSGNQVNVYRYPSNSAFYSVYGSLSTDAAWYIQEDTQYGNGQYRISAVDFDVLGNGAYFSHTFSFTPTYIWLRSNWGFLGTNSGTATFTSAGGTGYMGSNIALKAISPAIDISTAEDSNLLYGCFSSSPSILLYQGFGLGGHC
jgi:hypothetical protein